MAPHHISEQMTTVTEHPTQASAEDPAFINAVQSLGAPEDHFSAIVGIMRAEFETAEALLDALDTYQSPVAFRVPCTVTVRDCENDYRGAREVAARLKECVLMFHSHHVEPWDDANA